MFTVKLFLAFLAILSAVICIYTMITKKNPEDVIYSMLLHVICVMHYYFY